MPSIEENLNMWGKEYSWIDNGDEWSAAWGGTEYMWHGSILPRIVKNIPCRRILEIACVHGRISQYLLKFCEELILIDISESCIEHCKKRFAEYSHIKYFVNDGLSLDMIKDDSIDFVFSWDSLVHAEKNVIKNYLKELSKKLIINGAGFIHHSNIGIYKENSKLTVYNSGWRAEDMRATDFADFCADNHLICRTQEIFRWSSLAFSDCISYFYKHLELNPCAEKPILFENYNFLNEQWNINTLSKLYKSVNLNTEVQPYYLSFDNWKKNLIDISLKRKIYFWAIGKHFDKVLDFYKNEVGLTKIEGLIDKASEKWNKKICGINVFSPDDILNSDKYEIHPFIIITSSIGKNEIEMELITNNFKKGEEYLMSLYFY